MTKSTRESKKSTRKNPEQAAKSGDISCVFCFNVIVAEYASR